MESSHHDAEVIGSLGSSSSGFWFRWDLLRGYFFKDGRDCGMWFGFWFVGCDDNLKFYSYGAFCRIIGTVFLKKEMIGKSYQLNNRQSPVEWKTLD